MKTVFLNNGVEMPTVGLGTFDLPKDRMTEIVGNAYNAGYRKFDTASRYENEKELGEALRENGIKREDVFIQTKLNLRNLFWLPYRYFGRKRFLNVRNFRSIDTEIESSFTNLGTEYIDMFLIHWPWLYSPKLYRHLERYYREGKIRAIGVASFLPPHLDYLKEQGCRIIPMLNQFEISPLNTQKRLIRYCQENSIVCEAMSTFSHWRSSQPRLEILQEPGIMEIAKKHGRSTAQTVNRWLIEQDITIVPKSKSKNHIEENIDLFDFELTAEEKRYIDSLDKGKFLNYDPTHSFWGLPKHLRDSEWFNH